GGLALPAPWLSALLVLCFLGFGVLTGDLAASRPSYALSAARRPVKLILTAATAPAGTGSHAGAPGGESEPPAASSEPTPEASESNAAEASRATGSSKTSSTASKGAESEASSGGSGSRSGAGETNASSLSKLPPVKHVFVIMLSGEPFASAFGPSSTAPYVSHTLEHRGALLVRYYGVAHGALANGVALLSGQGPTVQTAAECPAFADISPGSAGAKGQVVGEGCVYPAATSTLTAQLARKHLKARAYVQGID